MQELFKLSIHRLNRLLRALHDRLQQLTSLLQRYLGLLLLADCEILERCIEVVPDLGVDLRGQVLLLAPDDLDELEALVVPGGRSLGDVFVGLLRLAVLVVLPPHLALEGVDLGSVLVLDLVEAFCEGVALLPR